MLSNTEDLSRGFFSLKTKSLLGKTKQYTTKSYRRKIASSPHKRTFFLFWLPANSQPSPYDLCRVLWSGRLYEAVRNAQQDRASIKRGPQKLSSLVQDLCRCRLWSGHCSCDLCKLFVTHLSSEKMASGVVHWLLKEAKGNAFLCRRCHTCVLRVATTSLVVYCTNTSAHAAAVFTCKQSTHHRVDGRRSSKLLRA